MAEQAKRELEEQRIREREIEGLATLERGVRSGVPGAAARPMSDRGTPPRSGQVKQR